MVGQVTGQRFEEFFPGERFGEVFVGTGQSSASTVEEPVLAGEHDHWNAAEMGVVFDEGAGLVAIQAWHHHIHQDEVGTFVGGEGQGLEAVAGGDDLVTGLLQQGLSGSPDGSAVVHHQDFRPLSHLAPLLRRFALRGDYNAPFVRLGGGAIR